MVHARRSCLLFGHYGASIALTDGEDSPLIFWLLFYKVGRAARLTGRPYGLAMIVGTAATITAVIAANRPRVGSDVPDPGRLLAAGIVAA